MSSTSCPNCGGPCYPGPNGHCEDCYYPPSRRLTLTGDLGSMSFGVRTRIGSALLLKLSSDAKYSEREEQFSVFCRESDWLILPHSSTKNATMINNTILKEECRLNPGDVLTLGSQSGTGKQVMRLLVGMVDA